MHAITDIAYQNIDFGWDERIAEEKAATVLVAPAAAIALVVCDENGATGVQLNASSIEGNTTDVYLNAMVAGNVLTFAAQEGAIACAKSNLVGGLDVEGGAFTYIPQKMAAESPADEILTVTMVDGTVYKVHVLPEDFPCFEITGTGVSADNAGIYTFVALNYLVRVDTDGFIVYFRNVGCAKTGNDFQPHETPEGMFFSYSVALTSQSFGKSEGMHIVMDDAYRELDYVTMAANDDPNHTHGAAYVDFHEIRVLGVKNYLIGGYNRMKAQLPDSLKGVDGTQDAYVWAAVFQQLKDDKPLWEINSTDYPLFFESSIESGDYAETSMEKPSDYMHFNAIDWLEDGNGNVVKIMISFRNQSSLVQFDVATGAIDWIFGGTASTLTGYEELDPYKGTRKNTWGDTFYAAMFGQHYCRYINKNADGTIDGNPHISLFDNATGAFPFLTSNEIPTLTRTYCFELDEIAGTTRLYNIVEAAHMHELHPKKYHFGDHCGSVDYFNDNSVMIGWGLDMIPDSTPVAEPKFDANYPDLPLYAGVHPVFSEYDMTNDQITFELSLLPAENTPVPSMQCIYYSYRSYKTDL